MTDRPILFSAPMVRAILREIEAPGTGKTQTRQVLKLRGYKTISDFGPSDTPRYDWHLRDAGLRWHDLRDGELRQRLSYAPGDRLWVREAFVTGYEMCDEYQRPVGDRRCWYRATDSGLTWCDPDTESTLDNPPWRPSIHMPRWASRLTLTVTDVRVQRLQDISEDDARAEGVELNLDTDAFWGTDGQGLGGATRQYAAAVLAFRDLWDSLNTKPGTGWDRNPWVAAITFTPRLGNIDSEAGGASVELNAAKEAGLAAAGEM